MQITRIKQIKDYRIFQNWHQRDNTDFARFTVAMAAVNRRLQHSWLNLQREIGVTAQY